MNDIQIAEAHIRAKVRMVADVRRSLACFPAGERIAVVLVLDRYDLLRRAWGSIAESIRRLGPQWTEAALRLQRKGWQEKLAE